MKKKDIFSIHTNQLITLLTCYNSHMHSANNKKEEQTALDEINEAIKSYHIKMNKTQLKWQRQNLICTATTLSVSMTSATESVKKKKKIIVATIVAGATTPPLSFIVKTKNK